MHYACIYIMDVEKCLTAILPKLSVDIKCVHTECTVHTVPTYSRLATHNLYRVFNDKRRVSKVLVCL